MKIRLLLFLLGILLLGGCRLADAGPSSKPPIPTKLLPPPDPTPVPVPVVIPPPPLKVSKDCDWVEQPLVYNNSSPAFYGVAPIGVVLGYSGCAIPVVAMPGSFYQPAVSLSTTKSRQWVCKTDKDKGGKS